MLKTEELYKIIDGHVESFKWPQRPRGLYAPLKYTMDLGGKRLRPRLCMVAYNLFSNKIDETILGPATSIELLHNFTLIHDDIMDKAELRRGKPTVYKKWDTNVAILGGDTMCLMAFYMVGKAPAKVLPKILELFAGSSIEVCHGQQMDMEFESRSNVSMAEYIKMIGLKTAVLLSCSAKMGAIIGGASDAIAEQIYKFVYDLGIAFQIEDDYLDSFGNEKIFGKKIGGDILNNKKTWLLVKCQNIVAKKSAQKRELDELLAINPYQPNLSESKRKQMEDKKIAAVQQFYRATGVDKLALQAIDKYYKKALQTLSKIKLTKAQKDRLEEFASSIVKRNK